MLKQRQQTATTQPMYYRGIAPGGGITDITYPAVTYLAESEFINSENSGKTRMNPCEHHCYIKWPISGTVADYIYPASSGIRHIQTNAEAATFLNDPGLSGGYDAFHPTYPSGTVLNDLAAMAWQAMRPSMSNAAPSLVNFLLEVNDLKRMFAIWNQKQSILKNISNGVLNWNFGWKPFWSDVKKIVEGLQKAGDRLAMLMAQAETVQTRHWQHWLSASELPLPVTVTNPIGEGYVKREYGWVSPARFNATARMGWRLKDAGFLTTTQAYLDALGVRLNPGIVWNAIPYTFIVDWFVDVGGWLDQYSADNLPVEVVLYDFCYTTEAKSILRLSRRFGATGSEQLLWCSKLEAYRRIPGLPTPFTTLQSSWPASDKWGLLAALAYQKVNDKRLVHAERHAWRGAKRQTKKFISIVTKAMEGHNPLGL